MSVPPSLKYFSKQRGESPGSRDPRDRIPAVDALEGGSDRDRAGKLRPLDSRPGGEEAGAKFFCGSLRGRPDKLAECRPPR